MDRYVIGAFALAALAFGPPAFAADPGVKEPPSGVSWVGLYLGGSVGGVWANDRIADMDGLNGVLGFGYTLKDSGIIGGGVIGYSFQWTQFVYGVEADLGGMGPGKTIAQPNAVGITSNHLGGGFYSDVTVRLGYAFDRALVYAKTGWAYFDGQANVDNTDGFLRGGVVSTGASASGWAIGGGLEYAFSQAWSAKVEYMHYDFGSTSANLFSPVTLTTFRFPNDLTADAVTMGVNYHFGH